MQWKKNWIDGEVENLMKNMLAPLYNYAKSLAEQIWCDITFSFKMVKNHKCIQQYRAA